MGILGSLMKGMGEAVARQLWPIYEEARRRDSHTLEKIIVNETNVIRAAVCLLALGESSVSKAKELYAKNRIGYNNAFNTLRNYRRFSPVIDMFMRKCTPNNLD